MKNKNKTGQKILSDKISNALTIKPRADIEDDQIFGTKPKTVSRADFGSSDSEDEALISDFRKRNENLLSDLSKKYEGEVVSRFEVEGNSNHSSNEVMSDDDISHEESQNLTINRENFTNKISQFSSDSDEINSDKETSESNDDSANKTQNSDTDSDESNDNEERNGYDMSQMNEPVKESFEHIKKQNVSDEVKKGACVRNQLVLWENSLEMRIHLQRCLNTANQMPLPEYYEVLKNNSNDEFKIENNIAKANIANLLNKLLELQAVLLRNHPETKGLISKSPKGKAEKFKPDSDDEIASDTEDEEIPSDTDDEEGESRNVKSLAEIKTNSVLNKKRKLEDYEKELHQRNKAFKTFRDSTIQKWNEKTRLVTAANIKNTPTNTILQQISYILSDRNKLIRRTQLKRSDYDIIGYEKKSETVDEMNPVTKDRKDDDEYIPEIFDDSDFYHQLLRELIECKSADISDPVQLSRQWIALQQMRSKMKRKVDTKATKGRKIKYVVHNKLVNFMAPERNTNWTDESKNELYSSLFGKLFEHSNVDYKKFMLDPENNGN